MHPSGLPSMVRIAPAASINGVKPTVGDCAFTSEPSLISAAQAIAGWSNSLSDRLRNHVQEVPDFPRPGVVYRDITPILKDPELFRDGMNLYRYVGNDPVNLLDRSGRRRPRHDGRPGRYSCRLVPGSRASLFLGVGEPQDQDARQHCQRGRGCHAPRHACVR